MASLVTLQEIQTRSRERTNLEQTDFITDSQQLRLINASYKKLWDMLRSAYGSENLTVTSSVVPLTGSYQGSLGGPYPLPNDFLDLHGMDFRVNSGNWETIGSFMMKERNDYPVVDACSYSQYRYKLINNGFYVQPAPPSTGVEARLWYTPVCPTLVSGSDTVDGVNGWEEYIVIDVAIQMLITHDDGDRMITQLLIGERRDFEANINKLASRRDLASPYRVIQTRTGYRDKPWYWRNR